MIETVQSTYIMQQYKISNPELNAAPIKRSAVMKSL